MKCIWLVHVKSMPTEFYLALITKYKLNMIADEPQKQNCGNFVNKTLLLIDVPDFFFREGVKETP